jgi:hypothetical protein
MSYGLDGGFPTEATHDSHYLTPAGHGGVTFVAGSGDHGIQGYPADSPNVLAVGGTSLTLGGQNNLASETAWSGSGGGISTYEPEPAYQYGVQQSGMRETPDVAYDADPATGFSVLDTYGIGDWAIVGGTSAGAPQWSAMIAIADQGRAQSGLAPFDGATQFLPLLYSLPSSDFHDITTGANLGYSASPGYDPVTGLGSPVANRIVADLQQDPHLGVTASPATMTAGTTTNVTVSPMNAYGTVVTGYLGTVHFSSTDGQALLPADYTFGAADRGTHTFSVTLKTAGVDSVTVSDKVHGLSGTTPITVTPAAAAVLQLSASPATFIAGTAGTITVTVRDAFGNLVTSYTGTVHFSSNDPKAVLPADYTFTAADKGRHVFSVTLKTAATDSVTVADAAKAIRGSLSVAVTPAAVAAIVLVPTSGFSSSTTSDGIRLSVTVEDAFGNVTTGYTGTVHFTCNDPKGTMPLDYTYSVTDQGSHTFLVYQFSIYNIPEADAVTVNAGVVSTTVTFTLGWDLKMYMLGPDGTLWVWGTNPDSTWSTIFGSVGSMVAAADGTAFALRTGPRSGQLWSWSNGTAADVYNSVLSLGVASDGTVYAQQPNNQLLRYQTSAWNNMQSAASLFAVAADGSFYIQQSNDQLLHYQGGSIAVVCGNSESFVLAKDGSVYDLQTNDALYRYQGGVQTIYDWYCESLAVAGDGTVYVQQTNDELLAWKSGTWTVESWYAQTFAVASDGTLYVLQTNDELLAYLSGAPTVYDWYCESFAIAKDGTL